MTTYVDLRQWLAEVEAQGELRRVSGADWNLEQGAITEMTVRTQSVPPALLFGDIPDYPANYRTLFSMLSSPRRLALTLSLPGKARTGMDVVKAYRKKLQGLAPLPPNVKKEGPILENVHTGDDINMRAFPAPFHHENDGGRYIGTGHAVITRDPDTGELNFGTYRVMVVDEKTVALHISPGKTGRIHRQKYFDRGLPCPVAISFGHDPLVFLSSCTEIPLGFNEFEFCGAIKGTPMDVIEGPVTGLPIPAYSEIAIEGEVLPDTIMEGPFGEWAGYYANNGLNPVAEPIVRVKAVYHRNDPILCCTQPSRPPHDFSLSSAVARSALIWNEIESAGIPGIKGVWRHPVGSGRMITIVSIKQQYTGHSKQVAAIASQCRAGSYVGRYVIVVDDDIDPSNTHDVLWAMVSRSDPERSIDILRGCWASSADPAIPMSQKNTRGVGNSVALIDACRPYAWLQDFPPVAEASPELQERILAKWSEVIGSAD